MNQPWILTARITGAALLAAIVAVAACSRQEETPMNTASTIGQESSSGETKVATFAAGCFWGVEQTFRQTEGVRETSVGYTGGHTEDPTYKQVCAGGTGHAEAVRVVYDPEKINYEQLLNIFWSNHDPTTPNRQGPDVGAQYRSAVFTHDEQQAVTARRVKQELDESGRFRRPIVTEITPAGEFYQAEDYHQQYYEKRGGGTCHF